jgi:hypothetical protein
MGCDLLMLRRFDSLSIRSFSFSAVRPAVLVKLKPYAIRSVNSVEISFPNNAFYLNR